MIILALLFIRSPWGQNIVVQKATAFLSEKTNTRVAIDRLYLTFSGDLFLEGLYLEDESGDTLIYSRQLETGIRFRPLIQNGAIHISKLEWSGLTANVSRDDSGRFNFDFITEAFLTPDGENSGQEATPATAADTASSSLPDIRLGPVRLAEFDVSYEDLYSGIVLDLALGSFELDVKSMDLNKMDFYVAKLDFKNTDIRYIQHRPFATEDEPEEAAGFPAPALILEELNLEGINLTYDSKPDKMYAGVELGKLYLSLPEANLETQNILVKEFLLHDTKLEIAMLGDAAQSDNGQTGTVEASAFEWPDWTVEVGKIDVENNDIAFRTSDLSPKAGFFNPSVMDFEDVTLKASGIALADNMAKVNLQTLAFREYSGFELRQFTLDARISEEQLKLDNIEIQTGNSQLVGTVALTYESIGALIDGLEWENLDLVIPKLTIGLDDALYFSPDLRNDPYVAEARRKAINGKLTASGNPDELTLEHVEISWGGTNFFARGSVENVFDTDRLEVDFAEISLDAKRADLIHFVSEADLGISLPEDIKLEAAVKGGMENLEAQISLETSIGSMALRANYLHTDTHEFKGEINLDQIDLGSLLNNPQMGSLAYRAEFSGGGSALEDLKLTLDSEFETLELMGYDYQGLSLQAEMNAGKGDAELRFEDENLDLLLTAQVQLDSLDTKVNAVLDLKGADLLALNLSSRDLRVRINYVIEWNGHEDGFDLTTSLEDGTIVFEETPYIIEGFDVFASVGTDTTYATLQSSLIEMGFAVNASPDRAIDAVLYHFDELLQDSLDDSRVRDTLINLALNLKIPRSRILQDVLLPGLEDWETFELEVEFDESLDVFRAALLLPSMTYSGIEIDSLGVLASGTSDDFEFKAGLVSLSTGPLSMEATYFEGSWEDNRFDLDFVSYDGEETLVHVNWDISFNGDTLGLHINPENLILNKREWGINENNLIQYAQKWLNIEDFELVRNDQRLLLTNRMDDVSEEHIGIEFKEFRLSTFTSLLNPDELIAAGFVNGRFILENPFGATGILADLKIDELRLLDVALGNLSIGAESVGEGAYGLTLALKDGGVDLDLDADYMADEAGARLDVDLALNELQMQVLEGLLSEQLEDAQGSVSGRVKVSGTTIDPVYEGDLSFQDVGITVKPLNATYKVSGQSLRVNNDGLYLDDFTINDEDGDTFVLSGAILTESLTNPSFDLKLVADNFHVLNSTREDNDLFYGTAIIDADVDIQGDLELPRVNAKLKVKSGTEFTFIIPETQLDIVERDGVVLFVNRDDPDDILTRRESEVGATGITGYQIAALMEADPDAAFRIVVDERSGDNLLVAGEANLNLNVDPNGRITLSGSYELGSGHYEMSLYNLVSRRFEIQEGSTISWSGDPLDASLNMTALYRVKTSAAELMAAQTAGMGADARVQYNQELPFLVYLKIEGDLTRLEPSFELDMPEEQRGAAGGNVYAQVQLLNSQEGELNRQVFSLLVLNRFFPDRGSDGAGGGTSALARSSVSQLLSGQLNNLSDNVLGDTGLELDFDLDSFTDYQTGAPQDRTQLNVSARSRFMDDRLIVQVGSQIDIEGSAQAMDRGNALLGNVSVEYLLTENGRYRLRGFRRNQFESFIDGQLITTGISVIFNREFNHFIELWRGIETKRGQANAIKEDENDAGQESETSEENENN